MTKKVCVLASFTKKSRSVQVPTSAAAALAGEKEGWCESRATVGLLSSSLGLSPLLLLLLWILLRMKRATIVCPFFWAQSKDVLPFCVYLEAIDS